MKRHILRLALLIVALTTILTSCGNKTPKDRTQYLPNITGNAGEVLIVINKSYWEGSGRFSLENIRICRRESRYSSFSMLLPEDSQAVSCCTATSS